MIENILYQHEPDLSPSEFKALLERSTLAERRPAEDMDRLKQMCANADLIITARKDGQLIGVARSISDLTYCTYLSDLAVDVAYQKKGIGKTLIAKTKEAAPQAKLILLSAPAAREYYPKIGMEHFLYCFTL